MWGSSGPRGDQRPAHAPFCSHRCRLIDVGKWSDGEHVIAGKPMLPELWTDSQLDGMLPPDIEGRL